MFWLLPVLLVWTGARFFSQTSFLSALVKYLLDLVLFLLFLHVPGFSLDRWVGNRISVCTEEKETLLIRTTGFCLVLRGAVL